jgi:hypothetical protein
MKRIRSAEVHWFWVIALCWGAACASEQVDEQILEQGSGSVEDTVPTDLQPRFPATYAWWVNARFTPTDTTVLGLPIRVLSAEWERASVLAREMLPAESESDPSALADSAFSFMHRGDFNGDGREDRAAVGVYETAAGTHGRFFAIVSAGESGLPEVAFVETFPGNSGFSVIYSERDTLTWFFCMECDHFMRLVWVSDHYEWEQVDDWESDNNR